MSERTPLAGGGSQDDRRGLDVRTMDRIAVLLDRAVPWLARVERPARGLLGAGVLASLWLLWLIADAADLDGIPDWAALLLVGAILIAPAVVLLGFVLTLRQLIGLPDQLRALPQTTREQASRLSGAIDALRRPRQSGVRGSAAGFWRARGVVFELAGLAEPFVGLAGLVRLPFLILVAAAAVAVVVEVVVAVVALLVVVAF